MRSVAASRKSNRSGGRAKPARRSEPRKGEDRGVFGRRSKFRTDPLSRFFRWTKRQLAVRKPITILTAGLLAATGIAALFVGGYVHRAALAIDRAGSAVAANAGFGPVALQIENDHHVPAGAIRQAIGLDADDKSIFAVDVQTARDELRKLPWVADAEVTRRYPDSIVVRLTERIPFGIWNNGSNVFVVDRDGDPIVRADRSQFPHLPLFVGEQPEGASDLVEAIATHRAVAARVKGMERVNGRRWNLILDNGVTVKLPEDGWDKQLAVLDQLIAEKGVLEFDIQEIDLRTHGHYTFVVKRPVTAPQHKTSKGDAA